MPKKNTVPAASEPVQSELEAAIAAVTPVEPMPPVLDEVEQPMDPVDAAIERHTKPTELAPEAPAVIEANDPEGRQPGDPNAPIELPAELLAPAPSNPNMIAFDSADDLDKFLASLPKAEPVVRPDVAVDAIRQPAEFSAKTLAELNAGHQAVVHSTEAEKQQVADGEKEAPFRPASEAASAAFSRPGANSPERGGVPVLHPRTLAEQQAGRDAIARKSADIAAARAIMAKANADRLKKGGAPDAGDLSYVAPR